MDIRADLSIGARLLPGEWEWVDSPQPGVRRVMLDRVGDEVAVATSFVRYDPASRFPGHGHEKGEEFIVLEGEFGDEHGRFRPFSYVRNPPGSAHVPFSDPGCLIWVKLRQFQSDDLTQMTQLLDLDLPAQGQEQRMLHQHGEERVAEIVMAAGESLEFAALEQPQEVLVLEGELVQGGEALAPLSWLRLPAGEGVVLESLRPSRVFWKTRPQHD